MHLFHQSQERAAEGHEIGQLVAGKHRSAKAKEVFGLRIGKSDEAFCVHHDDRMDQRIENELRHAVIWGQDGRVHAAFLPAGLPENASRIMASTFAGSVAAISAERHVSASPPQVSRYQPRCLRAWRSPCPTP